MGLCKNRNYGVTDHETEVKNMHFLNETTVVQFSNYRTLLWRAKAASLKKLYNPKKLMDGLDFL